MAHELAIRAAKVHLLRQRLVPRSLRRPLLEDDPAFDAASHIERATCHEGDQATLLAIATDAVQRPLPRTRPLWRAVVVQRSDGQALAVVVVLHHVMTDGLGGLAQLTRLADPPSASALPATPSTQAAGPVAKSAGPVAESADPAVSLGPSSTQPAASAHPSSASAASRPPGPRVLLAPRTSVNGPVGPRQRTVALDVDLARLRAAARTQGASVNDLILVAAAGALGGVLAARGERPGRLLAMMPIATRAGGGGNAFRVRRVPVPLESTTAERVAAVAAVTSAYKAHPRRAPSARTWPLMALACRTGLYRRAMDAQRYVNSSVSNVVGPRTGLEIAGIRVTRLVPLGLSRQGVAVGFLAVSYAGTLTVAASVDVDQLPEVDVLVAGLRDELRLVDRAGGAPKPGLLTPPGRT